MVFDRISTNYGSDARPLADSSAVLLSSISAGDAKPLGRKADTAAATAHHVESGLLPSFDLVDFTEHALSTAGTVTKDLATGAWHELKEHPLQVAEAAAVGLAVGVAATALTPVEATVLGVAGLAYGGYELAMHVGGWIDDVSTLHNASSHSAFDIAKAHADLQGVGADGLLLGAGVAGGLAARPLMAALSSATASADSAVVASDAPAAATGSDASAAGRPLSNLGTVNSDGVRVLNSDETAQLYAGARDTNGEMVFAKPDVQPGNPKYYQVAARQVDLSNYPGGLRVGTTEARLNASGDIPLANGQVIPKGELPTGVQLSGDTIHTPPSGVTLSNGTVLTDGTELPAGTGSAISGGQQVGHNDWIITRDTITGGKPAYDMYTPHDMSRWNPVAGQPGQFSPKSVPTKMVYIPDGKFQIPTSWGTAQGNGPSLLAHYDTGDYNVITLKDATESGYLSNPLNDAAHQLVALLGK